MRLVSSLDDESVSGNLEAFPGPRPMRVRRASLRVVEEERRMELAAPPKSSATGFVFLPIMLRDRVTWTESGGKAMLAMITMTDVEALES